MFSRRNLDPSKTYKYLKLQRFSLIKLLSYDHRWLRFVSFKTFRQTLNKWDKLLYKKSFLLFQPEILYPKIFPHVFKHFLNKYYFLSRYQLKHFHEYELGSQDLVRCQGVSSLQCKRSFGTFFKPLTNLPPRKSQKSNKLSSRPE